MINIMKILFMKILEKIHFIITTFILSVGLGIISDNYSAIDYFNHFWNVVNFQHVNRYSVLAGLLFIQFEFFYLMITDENKHKRYLKFIGIRI